MGLDALFDPSRSSRRRLRPAAKIATAAASAGVAALVVLAVAAIVHYEGVSSARNIPVSSNSLPSCPQPTPGSAYDDGGSEREWAGPSLDVRALDRHYDASCNLAGVVIRFPDGHTMIVPGIGESASESGPGKVDECVSMYEMVNMGTYGIAADRVSADGKHTQWWGNGRAVTEVKISDGEQGAPNVPGQCG